MKLKGLDGCGHIPDTILTHVVRTPSLELNVKVKFSLNIDFLRFSHHPPVAVHAYIITDTANIAKQCVYVLHTFVFAAFICCSYKEFSMRLLKTAIFFSEVHKSSLSR